MIEDNPQGTAPRRAVSPEEMARRIYFHHGIDETKPILREDVLSSLQQARANGVADGAERAAQWLGAKFGAEWLLENEVSLKQHIFALIKPD